MKHRRSKIEKIKAERKKWEAKEILVEDTDFKTIQEPNLIADQIPQIMEDWEAKVKAQR